MPLLCGALRRGRSNNSDCPHVAAFPAPPRSGSPQKPKAGPRARSVPRRKQVSNEGDSNGSKEDYQSAGGQRVRDLGRCQGPRLPARWRRTLHTSGVGAQIAGSSRMRSREARLRAEYSDWFPKISPGVWHDASWVTEIVLQQLRQGSPSWELGPRPLHVTHFEFRGGDPQPSPGAQRRRTIGYPPSPSG
jgi:hypothetical protein